MGLWRKEKKRAQEIPVSVTQTAYQQRHPFDILSGYIPLSSPEIKLYEAIREGVPLIDSAIQKTVRLVGGFQLRCRNRTAQSLLEHFAQTVNVGGSSIGLESFIARYLDSLLLYGNAIGEIVLDQQNGAFRGLYNAGLENIQIKQGASPMEVDFYVNDKNGAPQKIKDKDLVLFTALNPKAGEQAGVSLLRSLPFVTSILFQIYHSIGQNFERVGNVRYAVTYKPGGDSVEKAYTKERAQMIAREWSDGMRAGANGEVKDFITVGDVSIKAIGADNQMIDTEIPVRQMMEQIIAKMGIPPFLLGLSWSTTERMSQQQIDILTTELEFYRRMLTPVILRICGIYLRLHGYDELPEVVWQTINLKDEVEQAQAQYYLMQAKEIEQRLEQGGI